MQINSKTNTLKKIQIAIVGCGRISKNHFAAINAHSNDLELVAICDTDTTHSISYANQYNIPSYFSIEKMLEQHKPDLVSLCTPSGLHPEQAIISASHGANIITEKPMATRWSDGLRMVKACDDANVQLFVVKQNRLNPTLQLLKRAIEEKRFGKNTLGSYKRILDTPTIIL